MRKNNSQRATARFLILLFFLCLFPRAPAFPAGERPEQDFPSQDHSSFDESVEENGAEVAKLSTNNTETSKIIENDSFKMDFYDYLQLPKDPDDDIPVLPDQAVNVNEDYAGIYDYRGSQDGRFRRKRTLTTNIEQIITRSSRERRSITDNTLGQSVTPAEQAENLVTLLTVMQQTNSEFDIDEFLRVLDSPSVNDQDLEYLLFLSNLATSTPQITLNQQFYDSASTNQLKPLDDPRPVFLNSNSVATGIESNEDSGVSPEKNSGLKILSRLLSVASVMSEQGPAGIAM